MSDSSVGDPESIAPDDPEHGRIGYGNIAKYSPTLLGLFIVAIVVFMGWREWRPEDDLPRVGALVDRPAPMFSLTLLSGEEIGNASLLGSAVALNFWGSWCAPCEAEMPALDRVHAEMGTDGGMAVIGVGIKNDFEPNALAMIDELGIRYPIGRDTAGDDPQRGPVEQAFGVTTYPTTVFLRPDGTVFAVRIGEMSEDEIRDYLVGAAT
ncbi:MAG: TlpA family protein disulfide reductase [Thermomicrobiales bacterium]